MKKFLKIFIILLIICICLLLIRDVIIHNGVATKVLMFVTCTAILWLCLAELFSMFYDWAKKPNVKKEKIKQMKINVVYSFNNVSKLQRIFTGNTMYACIKQAIDHADAYDYVVESIEPLYE